MSGHSKAAMYIQFSKHLNPSFVGQWTTADATNMGQTATDKKRTLSEQDSHSCAHKAEGIQLTRTFSYDLNLQIMLTG